MSPKLFLCPSRRDILAANPGLDERYAQKRFLKQGEVISLP